MKNIRKRWGAVLLVGCLFLLLVACKSQPTETGETQTAPPSYPSYPSRKETDVPANSNSISASGWFTIIYNGEPHYYLNDDNGEKSQLLFDEASLKSVGGALQFDRKKVNITGELISENPRTIQVQTIQIQE